MIRSRSRWNTIRNGCSGSGWRRPRDARLGMAYGARPAASRSSSACRLTATRPPCLAPLRLVLRVARLDDHLHGDPDLSPDLDRHRIRPELLDGLVEQDPAPIDRHALRREQPFDVEVRDRAEEPALLPCPGTDAELEALDLLRLCLRRLAVALRLGADHALLVLEHAQILAARLDGEAAREQIVARVPGLDAHDVADLAQVRYVVTQDDLDGHDGSPQG